MSTALKIAKTQANVAHILQPQFGRVRVAFREGKGIFTIVLTPFQATASFDADSDDLAEAAAVIAQSVGAKTTALPALHKDNGPREKLMLIPEMDVKGSQMSVLNKLAALSEAELATACQKISSLQ